MGTLVLVALVPAGAWVVAVWVWSKTGLPPFFSFGPNRRVRHGVRVSLVLVFMVITGMFIWRELSFPVRLIHLVHSVSLMVWLGLALGIAVPAFRVGRDGVNGSALRPLAADLYPLLWVAAGMMALSGLVASLFYFTSWSQLFETAAGLKLLVKTGLFFVAIAFLILSPMAGFPEQKERESRKAGASGLGFSFISQAVCLGAALLVSVLVPFDVTVDKSDLHQHDDPFQFHFTHQNLEDGRTKLAVYVLQDRKRLSVSQLYFDVWPEQYHDEVNRYFDTICIDLNLGLEAWREVLVENGYIESMQASEGEAGLYTATFSLSPGVWHVRVHALHDQQEGFKDFILSIPDSSSFG
jgi:hypothetical protein